MKIEGTTSLDRLESLPQDLRALLDAMWVNSVEELLSVLAAVALRDSLAASAPARSLQTARHQALALVGPEKREALNQPKPGGELGCRIKPEVMERFGLERRVGPQRQSVPIALATESLPPVVRLMPSLSPVKDQGRRGTCVGFAAVALKEFLAPESSQFSEQFLYWACKQLDGLNEPGTYIHTAMSALSQYGVCLASIWPYNPRPVAGNESQSPPPPHAVKEAQHLRMIGSRPVEPSLVAHYKQVLAGDTVTPGMPVVMGVLVFESWFQSAETHRTGKITLPFPDEWPVGGHAMCVMGYVDDASVPGGGYFIVRNSWGPKWAVESPEAPGHALLPFAYVERYVLEAFTGPSSVVEERTSSVGLGGSRFVRTLSDNASPGERRDIEGKLLLPGMRVLCHPTAPQQFMEDTETNRSRFEAQDNTWDVSTRRRVWFPPVNCLSQKVRSDLDRAQACKETFLGALDENMKSAPGSPFPTVHAPCWFKILPYEWEPKIQRTAQIADLTNELVKEIETACGTPSGLPWPKEWSELAERCHGMRVYAVEGLISKVHVVVAFITTMHFEPDREPFLEYRSSRREEALTLNSEALITSPERGLQPASPPTQPSALETPPIDSGLMPKRPEGRYVFSGVRPSPGAATLGHDLAFEPSSTLENAGLAVAEDGHTPLNRYESRLPDPSWPGQSLVAAVQSVYQRWLASEKLRSTSFTFLTIGFPDQLPELAPALASGDQWIVLSGSDAVDRWTSHMPPRFSDRKSLRDFSDRLLPETRRERAGRIKHQVDDLLSHYRGNVTVDLISKQTGYRRSVVRDGFVVLQEQGPDDYRLHQTSDGQLSIRRTEKCEPVMITAASFRRRFIRQHAVRIFNTALSLAAGQAVSQFIDKGIGSGLVIGVLIAYFTNCLQAAIARRISPDKELNK